MTYKFWGTLTLALLFSIIVAVPVSAQPNDHSTETDAPSQIETGVLIDQYPTPVNEPRLRRHTNDDEWVFELSHIREAQQLLTPANQREPEMIGMIDSGLERSIPSFVGDQLSGKSINTAPGPWYYDPGWHGTTGTASMVADGTQGSEGVCPQGICSVFMLRSDAGGINISWGLGSVMDVHDAGARVLNLSAGGYDGQGRYEIAAWAEENDLLFVSSAGNDGTTRQHFPSSIETVIGVGCVDENGNRKGYSNYGDTVEVAIGCDVRLPERGQTQISTHHGTSFGSPKVAAIGAMIRREYPGLTAAQVREAIYETAIPHPDFIYGIVDAEAALQYAGTIVNGGLEVDQFDVTASPLDASGRYTASVSITPNITGTEVGEVLFESSVGDPENIPSGCAIDNRYGTVGVWCDVTFQSSTPVLIDVPMSPLAPGQRTTVTATLYYESEVVRRDQVDVERPVANLTVDPVTMTASEIELVLDGKVNVSSPTTIELLFTIADGAFTEYAVPEGECSFATRHGLGGVWCDIPVVPGQQVQVTVRYDVNDHPGQAEVTASLFTGGEVVQLSQKLTPVSQEPPALSIRRLAGPSRVETAVEISKDQFPGQYSAAAVVLSRADLPVDSLAGAPFANWSSAPMFLTWSEQLHHATRTEIERVLSPGGTVYILGGSVAVSTTVDDELRSAGYHVERVSGPTRVETAAAISEKIPARRVIVTDAEEWQSALVAGSTGVPILLTYNDALHPVTQSMLGRYDEVTALGTTTAFGNSGVSPSASLSYSSFTELSIVVAEHFQTFGSLVVLASDTKFPDGLAGSTLAARRGGSLMLTDPNELDTDLYNWIKERHPHVVILGGEAAIAQTVEDVLTRP